MQIINNLLIEIIDFTNKFTIIKFFGYFGLFFGITPKKFIFFSRMYGNQCCVIQSTNFFRLSEFNALIEMFNTFVFVLNPISGAFNWQYR